MIDHSEYHREMLRAMEQCQFIEETMKLCILSAIEIAQLMTSRYFKLNYNAGDIIKLPMGALIKKFSRINHDEELLKELRAIIKDRNFVAHQSLLFTLGELADTNTAEEALGRLRRIGDKASDIHGRLLEFRYTLVREKQRAIRNAIENNA